MNTVEQLSLDVALGRMSQADGEQVSAAMANDGRLDVDTLAAWFSTAVWMTGRESWERGLLLGRLLHAALEALPDDPPSPQRALALCRSDWLEIAHLALVHRPDAGLQASGRRSGEAALATARRLGDDGLAGDVLYRLGVLFLDPASRPRAIWAEEHRLWLSLDPEAAAGLPEPPEALATARRYLTEAVALRAGPALGYTVKALAQAIQQQSFLSTDADNDSQTVAGLCQQALELIPATDVTARAAVEQMAAESGT